jgi:hypothetical protein
MHSSSHLSFSRESQMTGLLYIAPGSSLPMQLPLPSQVQLPLSAHVTNGRPSLPGTKDGSQPSAVHV